MEKRTILAIVLCIAVWLIWQALLVKPPPQRADGGVADGGMAQQAEGPSGVASDGGSGVEQEEVKPPDKRPAEKTATLETAGYQAVFTSRGAALKALYLKNYRARSNETGLLDATENIVRVEDEPRLPLRISFRKEKDGLDLPHYSDWEILTADGQRVVFQWQPSVDRTITIRKSFSKTEVPYALEMEVEIANGSDRSIPEQILVNLSTLYQLPPTSGCFGAPAQPTTAACMANGNVERRKAEPGKKTTLEPQVNWTGIDEQYFLLAAVPLGVSKAACILEADQHLLLASRLMLPQQQLPPGGKAEHRFRIFAGPKKLRALQAVTGGTAGDEKPAGLDKSVDFGWFSILCYPMLWALKTFNGWVGNYGIAIIFLTILIKLLLLPLTHKSMKSMKDMAKLKPLMEELKKKYKDDKQRLNQEMMNLYKIHKINPLGGCFPMLLQMPIWIALYRMLYSSVELYQTPFIAGWIDDLSWRDPYFIMPIVLGLAMFLQQKLSPTSVDSQQAKMMMYAMPVFMTFIMLYLPSGLVLYIFVNSLLSIGHQLLLNRSGATG